MNSAVTILEALDRSRYAPVLIGVGHDGAWWVADDGSRLTPATLFGGRGAVQATPALQDGLAFRTGDRGRDPLSAPLDVVFPIIHGRGGEDGSLQGLLETANIPYVGAGALSSSLCLDKSLSKRVLRDAGLPVVPSIEFTRADVRRDAGECAAEAERSLAHYPVFVKPAMTGSSVGIQPANHRARLVECLVDAARYDLDVLVEPAVDAREIECAVLGGADPQASVLGEVISAGEFYDYEAKYERDDTQLVIPATLPGELADRLRSLATRAFRATKCWGMARVDFFVARCGDEVWVNELNTLPGFTPGSMYPLLWEASGVPLSDVVHRLIELAMQRHRERGSLATRFTR